MAISYVFSDRFRTTNNADSLWLARAQLNEDLFLVEGDVVFDVEILSRMRAVDAAAVAAISPWKSGMSGTVAQIDATQRVNRLLLAADQEDAPGMSRMFKTVNIHLLRAPYLQGRRRGSEAEGVLASLCDVVPDSDCGFVIRRITMAGWRLICTTA
ncbi:MAG: hypothetical protein ACRDQU_16960 [Pseudonocardiaceae bacterium]